MLEQKVTTLESMTIKFFKWLKWDTLVKKKKKERRPPSLYNIDSIGSNSLCNWPFS